jgi:hypothetical protein
MNKKGNPRKVKKRVIKFPKRKVTNRYGYIPKRRQFCIICKLINNKINNKNLTVHHDIPQSIKENNNKSNLEIICEKHHTQLHHKYFYKKVKRVYEKYRKAKFNKIQTT